MISDGLVRSEDSLTPEAWANVQVVEASSGAGSRGVGSEASADADEVSVARGGATGARCAMRTLRRSGSDERLCCETDAGGGDWVELPLDVGGIEVGVHGVELTERFMADSGDPSNARCRPSTHAVVNSR